MKIATSDERVKELVLSTVPVVDILSEESISRLKEPIRSDFEEGVEQGWSSSYEMGYDLATQLGIMKLERDALNYAIGAFEGSVKDFLDEFVDYLDGDDGSRKEIYGFIDLVDNGEVCMKYNS